MNENKNYYAVIPATVRYDENLTDGAKLLYGEITALCNQQGFCWASNKYFAELYKNGERTIQRWVSSLFDNGYININYQYKLGTKFIEKRCISIVDLGIKTSMTNMSTYGDNNDVTPRQICPEDGDKNGVDNNTNTILQFNNTNTDEIEPVLFDIEDAFQVFYKKYPIHKKRKDAFKSFSKAIKSTKKLDEVMEALENQINFYNHKKNNKEFVAEFPMPSAWINQERWDDEVEIIKVESKKEEVEVELSEEERQAILDEIEEQKKQLGGR